MTFHLTTSARWALLRTPEFRWLDSAAGRVRSLTCIVDVYIPCLHGKPCLATLFLAKWPVASTTAWHEIRRAGARPLSWPVHTITEEQLTRFREALLASEIPHDEPAPCVAGDRVTVNFPGMSNVTGHCIWTNKNTVCVKIILFNRDMKIELPFSAIQAVISSSERQ